jgi:hypothetical protein
MWDKLTLENKKIEKYSPFLAIKSILENKGIAKLYCLKIIEKNVTIHVDVVLDWSCWGREKILSFLILQITSKISLSHFHLFFKDRYFLTERPELFFEIWSCLVFTVQYNKHPKLRANFSLEDYCLDCEFFIISWIKFFVTYALAISSIKFYVLFVRHHVS